MMFNTYGFLGKIYATFRNIIILDPAPAKMRDYCKISKELKSDGSNVAGVLCALSRRKEEGGSTGVQLCSATS